MILSDLKKHFELTAKYGSSSIMMWGYFLIRGTIALHKLDKIIKTKDFLLSFKSKPIHNLTINWTSISQNIINIREVSLVLLIHFYLLFSFLQ